ncbi:hypothetical protein BASA81_010784 [Batrachochytrium salamandrivorans]|nr:hypothetical protein BASA81_010784 [Batrachochytrium salamandrivorans]
MRQPPIKWLLGCIVALVLLWWTSAVNMLYFSPLSAVLFPTPNPTFTPTLLPTSTPTSTPTSSPTSTLTPTSTPTSTLNPTTDSTLCSNRPMNAQDESVFPAWTLKSPFLQRPLITNIVVAVLTSQYTQNESIPAIKQTWGAQFAHLEFFSATALPGLVTKVVPTDKRYARSSMEDMHAMRILFETYPNAEWYLKTDDDAFVNVPVLLQSLADFPPQQPWFLGQPLMFNPSNRSKPTVQYCAGGAGSLWSQSMMKQLVAGLKSPPHLDYCCSDVQYGKILSEANHGAKTCTLLSPYIVANKLNLMIQMESLELKGYAVDRYGKRRQPRAQPLANAMAQIPLMHYVSPKMQLQYFALFHYLSKCETGLDQRDTLRLVIPSFTRWDRKPCKPNLYFNISCNNSQSVFHPG